MKLSDYWVSDIEIRLCVKSTMDAWSASNRGRMRMPNLNADDAIAHAKDLWEGYIKTPEDLPRYILEHSDPLLVVHEHVVYLAAKAYLAEGPNP
jgi:hypothetical protein